MCDTAVASLEDAKGQDVKILDVRKLTDITDYMIVATGTSDRHVKTIADRVLEFMLAKGWKPLGMEGEESRDWVLVDFVDIVVHIMRDKARRHFDLESLWDETFVELSQTADSDAEVKSADSLT
jgi:ribosome-associated protein